MGGGKGRNRKIGEAWMKKRRIGRMGKTMEMMEKKEDGRRWLEREE